MANILGVNTGAKGWAEATDAISAFYYDGGSHLIVTPNPEIILDAQEDEELFFILNSADLSLADGYGLKIGARLSKQKLERVTGADLLPHLLKEAETNGRRLVIINRQDGLSSEANITQALKKDYPRLQSLIINSSQSNQPSEEDLELIRTFNPVLAICLLGSPYQEKYIYHLREKLTQLSVAVGLGGAFDFLTGQSKRAPKIWRKLGFEWLYRLIKQPSRWRRIWNATGVFTAKLLHWLYILPNLYRPNVAVLMYRRQGNDREIFTVERQGQTGHWQLPQGGLDNLPLEEAGIKELQEEAGVKSFKVIASFENLFRYDFNKENGRYANPKGQKHFGYKGQKQGLLITEFLGDESEVKINFWDHQAWRWVREDKLVSSLHECRQEAAKIYINKLKELSSKL